MTPHPPIIPLTLLFATGTFLMGCIGPPGNNPLLESAWITYLEAENDSVIVAYAPFMLQEAEMNLREGERLSKSHAGSRDVEHHAYLARQQVRIARKTAELNRAKARVKQAVEARRDLLMTAGAGSRDGMHTGPTGWYAETMANHAVAAHREAEAALEEALRLADRISDLDARQTERGLVLTLGDVIFDANLAHFKPGSAAILDAVASFLNAYRERNVQIEGFTDSTGPEAYNLDLSHIRAEMIKQALAQRGVESNRISVRGYGEAHPVASNGTSAGRRQNRRMEIILSDERGQIPERIAS